MADELTETALAQSAAVSMLLESVLETLVSRAILPAGDIIDIMDVCLWAVEEQPTGPGLSVFAKAAQLAFLQSQLERLENHPVFAEVAKQRLRDR